MAVGDQAIRCNRNIRNRWGPGLVAPPGESWPLLRVSQIGVSNLNVRVCSLLLRLPTVRPLVRLRIIGPAFGFENQKLGIELMARANVGGAARGQRKMPPHCWLECIDTFQQKGA